MVENSFDSVFGVLLRYGVPSEQAKNVAMNELLYFDPDLVSRVFSKVERPSARYCPLESAETTEDVSELEKRFRPWRLGAYAREPKRISPPRAFMRRAVKEQAALCTNIRGEWAVMKSGYAAISHVWSESLRRDTEHDAVELSKVQRVFTLLRRAGLDVEWIWTDVIAVPSKRGSGISVEDDLKTDIINTLRQVYADADFVAIFDALLLQLNSEEWLNAAILLNCGRWVTRVWTYQKSKLPQQAVVLTRNTHYGLQNMAERLKQLTAENDRMYRSLWLSVTNISRIGEIHTRLSDIVFASQSRKTTNDVEYARALFPLLGLPWEQGMTREQGMQKIYRSRTEEASRLVTFYGAPLMRISPGGPNWLPSNLTRLQGQFRGSIAWECRGVRGDWFVIKLKELESLSLKVHRDRVALNFRIGGTNPASVHCSIMKEGYDDVLREIQAALAASEAYVLSSRDFVQLGHDFAPAVLVVRKADCPGFEAALLSVALLTEIPEAPTKEERILLRHGSPYLDSDLENTVLFDEEQGSGMCASIDSSEAKALGTAVLEK